MEAVTLLCRLPSCYSTFAPKGKNFIPFYLKPIAVGEEMSFLKGDRCSYGPFSSKRRQDRIGSEAHIFSLLSEVKRIDKRIVLEYKKAISEINEGFTREILIRHLSIIEKDIIELDDYIGISVGNFKLQIPLIMQKSGSNY